MRRRGLALAWVAAWALPVMTAQAPAPGPQVAQFRSTVDGSDQPYGLYVPRGYTADKAWPLVIMLHGAYSNHRLELRRIFGVGNRPGESDASATRVFPPFPDVPYLVATPYARGTMGYQGIPEQDVYDVLAAMKQRFRVDEDRVYLTGLSMGGGGALWLGLSRPDLWAAIAPVCPLPPPGTDELAANALHLPVHLFHGELDPVVPVDVSRQWFARFKDLDVQVDYKEYPRVRHDSWNNAYAGAAIFDWFAQFKRNPYPERVRFTAADWQHRQAYWVRINELEPGQRAFVDARFTGPNQLAVTVEGTKAVSLVLRGHPRFTPGKLLRLTVNGAPVRLPLLAQRFSTVSLLQTAKGWQQEIRDEKRLGTKPAGVTGPLSHVLGERHLYVYGTADDPAPAALEERRRVAEQAAEWSTSQLPLLLDLPVKADVQVTDADLQTGNLVLFGDQKSNSIIARLTGQQPPPGPLPLRLSESAADYGLLYVFPLPGGRLALVNSGLPWMTHAEEIQRGYRLAPKQFALLQGLGDYVLFRRDLRQVVAEGYFTNGWQLTTEDKARLRATKVVEVP